MGVAILGEAFVGAAFATTVSRPRPTSADIFTETPFEPLCYAVASEVLPHRHRLAGQACINSVGDSVGFYHNSVDACQGEWARVYSLATSGSKAHPGPRARRIQNCEFHTL